MDVELIKIPPEVARRKLDEYRKAIAARAHTKASEQARREWERIRDGYEAAAKGYQLIELSKAMARGGWDEQGRPRFAVARADRVRVRCNVNPWSISFEASPAMPLTSRLRFISFRAAIFPARPQDARAHLDCHAIVPIVPPDKLPRVDADLSRRVILWEADWSAPPIDPLLLLPIGGDLYAVEAAWDLTPLERAILTDRLS